MNYDAYVDVTTLKNTRLQQDRIRQLIGMITVNLSIVCKFIFAFPHEYLCKGKVKCN